MTAGRALRAAASAGSIQDHRHHTGVIIVVVVVVVIIRWQVEFEPLGSILLSCNGINGNFATAQLAPLSFERSVAPLETCGLAIFVNSRNSCRYRFHHPWTCR
jgi:hypothetical protein